MGIELEELEKLKDTAMGKKKENFDGVRSSGDK